jgi:hypothetical protein
MCLRKSAWYIGLIGVFDVASSSVSESFEPKFDLRAERENNHERLVLKLADLSLGATTKHDAMGFAFRVASSKDLGVMAVFRHGTPHHR